MKYLPLTLIVSVALCVLAPASFATPRSSGFTDVPQEHDAYDAVQFVRERGIVEGYQDGSYKPSQTINRAEFTKIIVGAQFSEEIINDCARFSSSANGNYVFSDVPMDAWFTPYVCVAHKNGIIKGYPDGSFRPSQEISFVEASKIVIKSFGYTVDETMEPWYKPFVLKLEERSSIPTSVSSFTHTLRRGEMAEVVYRLMKQVKNKPSQTFEQLEKGAQPTSQTTGKGLTISWSAMNSTLASTLKQTGSSKVIIEVPAEVLWSDNFHAQWSAQITPLKKAGIAVEAVVIFFPQGCSTTAAQCLSSYNFSDASMGFASQELLAAFKASVHAWEQGGAAPDRVYLDPLLDSLYRSDPLLPTTLGSFLKALQEQTTLPIALSLYFNVNDEQPEFLAQYSAWTDGVGLYLFPSIIGDMSREEMWTVVDSWLSASKNISQSPKAIIGIGFPTQAPFGSEAMQAQFAELIRTYMSHYGDGLGVVSWYGLTDMSTHRDPYFQSTGLFKTDGSKRPSFIEWSH